MYKYNGKTVLLPHEAK